MSKKKDCYGSETYVCRTPRCPYAQGCALVLDAKRTRRRLAAPRRAELPTLPGFTLPRAPAEVRLRSRDHLRDGR